MNRLGVEACRLADPQQPYAGNVLHNLEAHGLRTHAGGELPTSPFATPRCQKGYCVEPSVLLIEVGDSARYRTYGYTLPPAGSAGEGIWLIDLMLSIPPFS